MVNGRRALLMVVLIFSLIVLMGNLVHAADPIGIVVSPGELKLYGYSEKENVIDSSKFGEVLFGNPTSCKNILWFNIYIRDIDGESSYVNPNITVTINKLSSINSSSLNPGESWYITFKVTVKALPADSYQFKIVGELRPVGSSSGSPGCVSGSVLVTVSLSDDPKLPTYSITVFPEPVGGLEVHSRIYLNDTYKGTTPHCIGSLKPGSYEVKVEDTSQYRFVRWADDVEDNPRVVTIVDKDIKLYAVYESIPVPFYLQPLFLIAVAGVLIGSAYVALWRD